MTVAELWPWAVVAALAAGIGWAAKAWRRDDPDPVWLAEAVTGLGPERPPGRRAERTAQGLDGAACCGDTDLRDDAR